MYAAGGEARPIAISRFTLLSASTMLTSDGPRSMRPTPLMARTTRVSGTPNAVCNGSNSIKAAAADLGMLFAEAGLQFLYHRQQECEGMPWSEGGALFTSTAISGGSVPSDSYFEFCRGYSACNPAGNSIPVTQKSFPYLITQAKLNLTCTRISVVLYGRRLLVRFLRGTIHESTQAHLLCCGQ